MNKEVERNPNILKQKKEKFEKMISFVTEHFENGFAKSDKPQVSRVHFEAISVGSLKVIEENPNLITNRQAINNWLKTGELSRIVSGKYQTHSKHKILERIDYVKEHLLKND